MKFDYSSFKSEGINRNRDLVGTVQGTFQGQEITCRAYQASNSDLVIVLDSWEKIRLITAYGLLPSGWKKITSYAFILALKANRSATAHLTLFMILMDILNRHLSICLMWTHPA